MNIPHRDAQGRFIHYCMHPSLCEEWGAFGFNEGELFLCGTHRAEYLAGYSPQLEIQNIKKAEEAARRNELMRVKSAAKGQGSLF